MKIDSEIEITVILPAYREAKNLDAILPRLKRELKKLVSVPEAEIIVVDSRISVDSTTEVCQRHNVLHIPRVGNDMYGSAVRTGIAQSQGKYVVIMDADGSHSPEFLNHLWVLRDKSTVVIASRYMRGGVTDNPKFTVAMSNLLNILYSKILNLPVLDVSNSFRLYDGPPLRSLHLKCRHFDVQEEILVKLLWEYGQTVREVPYHFKKRIYGRSKRSLLVFAFHLFKSLLTFYRLRRQLRRSFTK